MSARKRANSRAIVHLIQCLRAGGRTYDDIASQTGLHSRTVREWVQEFRRVGLVYIRDYVENSRGLRLTPVWAWRTKGEADIDRASLPRKRDDKAHIAEKNRIQRQRRKVLAAGPVSVFNQEIHSAISTR